jgi:hypothetical protein
VSGPLTCPRCSAETRPPGLWSDAWVCPLHGEVRPLHPPVVATPESLTALAHETSVPLWLPWPLPAGWVLSGVRTAGDAHSGTVATVLACSGPNPLPSGGADDRQADLLLVAETPGVGLGAHLAGLADVDPGNALEQGPPHLKLTADGHPAPLWTVATDGLVAYVGEACGVWLWVLVWPQSAAAVLLETFELVDLRVPDRAVEALLDVPYGALSPRLTG